MNRIRKRRIVPLIIILILICVVPTILLVGAHIVRPQETAELNKEVEQQEEKIEAATTTVQAGDTYTVPKTGLYKIELHGGKSNGFVGVSGLNGSKITGYVNLTAGSLVSTTGIAGGEGFHLGSSNNPFYPFGNKDYGMAGNSLNVKLNRIRLGLCFWCAWGILFFGRAGKLLLLYNV